MNLIFLSVLMLIPLKLLSMMYKKKFMLPIMLALESMLLIIMSTNFMMTYFFMNNYMKMKLSLFIMALAAMEASIGLSILTLITRNFSECSIMQLNLLNK